MRHWLRTALGGVATLALLAATAPAPAQAPAVDPRFEGHYRYAEPAEVGQRRIRTAVQPILRRLNPFARVIAQGRVDDTRVPRQIDIAVADGRVEVRYVSAERDRTIGGRVGYPEPFVSDSGREAQLTHVFRDGQLQQIFVGERGRWYNLFQLDESGDALRLEVVITGERLESPLRVELPYRRVD